MPRATPGSPPVVLSIAGSDAGGGAGIQADIKTIEATGAFATTAVTAVTAQNTTGVTGTEVLPASFVAEQLDTVLNDIDVSAIKTGMLATEPIIDVVIERIKDLDIPIIIDPVMVAASGDRLLDTDAEARYTDLVGYATLVTPNAAEAQVLTGIDISDRETAVDAGRSLLEYGAEAALLKGGHWADDPILDVLVTADGVSTVEHPRIKDGATHGSGCTLASSIASQLAHGADLERAVDRSVALIERAIRFYHDIGGGPGAVHHLSELRHEVAYRATQDAVRNVVDALVAADADDLLPEVGMNIVGAPEYATEPSETLAIDGRLHATIDGLAPTGPVRPGASGHVARLLMAVRERDPAVHFAANCRFDDAVEVALGELDGRTVELDRREEPTAEEGQTMQWVAQEAISDDRTAPVAVFDRGAHGKEPMTRVFGDTGPALSERLLRIQNVLDS